MAFLTKRHSTFWHCLTVRSRSKTWSNWLPAWWPSARNRRNLGSRWGTTATSTRRVLGKNLSLGISTVETNRDRDRDQLLKLVEIILTVETRLFFFSVEIFKIETFQSRFSCVKGFVETVQINRDFQDFWDFIKTFGDLSRYLETYFLPVLRQIKTSRLIKTMIFHIWHNLWQKAPLNGITLGQREPVSNNRLLLISKWSKAGVLNLLVLAYPQIKIVPLCVPPSPSRTPK